MDRARPPETAHPLAQTQRYLVERCRAGQLETGCYHTQFSYHLQVEALALPLFFKALSQVIERHPIMRTAFVTGLDGEIRQRIDPARVPRIGFDDIRALGPDAQESWLRAWLAADRARPFALIDGDEALVRLHLVRRATDALQFILVFHHAIWDGWSLAVLMKEVLGHYQQLKAKPTAKLAPARYDYLDFIEDEAASGASVEAAQFWARHLSGHEGDALPAPLAAGADAVYEPLTVVLPADLVQALEQCALRHKLPLRTLFIAATVAMAGDLRPATHNNTTATIGIVSNGRSIRLRHPLTTLGLLWNMSPLCVDLGDVGPGGEDLDPALLRRVQDGLDATAHFSFYPLRAILAQQRRNALFAVSFNYIDFGGANILPKDAGIRFLETGGFDKFHHPLNVLVGRSPFDRAISLVFNYDARLFTAAAVDLALRRFIARLGGIARPSTHGIQVDY